MADDLNEDLWTYLERREQQTLNRIEFTRTQLQIFEADLEQIKRAKAAIGPPSTEGALALGNLSRAVIQHAIAAEPEVANRLPEDAIKAFDVSPIVVMGSKGPISVNDISIKQLIVFALMSKKFRLHGAGAQEIREFIKDVYARDIERTSLSPQLSRLSKDGLVNAYADGRWGLSNQALNMSEKALMNLDKNLSDGLKPSRESDGGQKH